MWNLTSKVKNMKNSIKLIASATLAAAVVIDVTQMEVAV